jgi:hypothetical protein
MKSTELNFPLLKKKKKERKRENNRASLGDLYTRKREKSLQCIGNSHPQLWRLNNHATYAMFCYQSAFGIHTEKHLETSIYNIALERQHLFITLINTVLGEL